jgi:hypothetical protein
MPSATKDHRSKKNSSANEQFNRRRAALNRGDETHRQFQKMWRRAALTARAVEGRLTDKNMVEMETVGLHFKRS